MKPLAACAALALSATACGGVANEGELDEASLGESNQALTVSFDPRKSLFITDFDVVDVFSLKEVLDQLSDGHALEVFQQMFATELLPGDEGAGDGPNCEDINGWKAECPRLEGLEATRDPFGTPNADNGYKAITISNRFDLAPPTGENCGEYRLNFARRSGHNPEHGDSLKRLFIAFEARLPNPNPSLGLAGCRPIMEFWRNLSLLSPASRATALKSFYFNGLPAAGVRPVLSKEFFGANFGPQGGQIRVNQFVFIDAEIGDWSAREFRVVPQPGQSPSILLMPTFNKDVPARPLFNPVPGDDRAVRFQRDFFPESVERLALQDLNVMNYAAPVPDEYNSGDSHMVGGSKPIVELFNDYGEEFGKGPSALRSRIQAKLSAMGSPLTPDHIVERAASLSCGGCHNISQDKSAGALGFPGSTFPRSMGFSQVTEDLQAVPGEPSRQRYEASPLVESQLLYRAQLMRDFLVPIRGFERDGAWSSSQATVTLATAAATKTEGTSSLRVVPTSGYSEIKNIPTSLVGAGVIGPNVKLDVLIPSNQANASWKGQVGILVKIPSARIDQQWVGQATLDGATPAAFKTLTFALPANVRRILNYGVTDVVFTIQLNVSANSSPYYLDNLRFQ